MPHQMQKKIVLTNSYTCSKFWGNLEGIWGNPGEIPYVGWKIRGVQRVKDRVYRFGCPHSKIGIFPELSIHLMNAIHQIKAKYLL